MQALVAKDNIAKKKSAMTSDVAKALGRISTGLYVVAASHNNARSAMVASWVSQASFEPLGLTIAVAKDRAIESMMQVCVCLPYCGVYICRRWLLVAHCFQCKVLPQHVCKTDCVCPMSNVFSFSGHLNQLESASSVLCLEHFLLSSPSNKRRWIVFCCFCLCRRHTGQVCASLSMYTHH